VSPFPPKEIDKSTVHRFFRSNAAETRQVIATLAFRLVIPNMSSRSREISEAAIFIVHRLKAERELRFIERARIERHAWKYGNRPLHQGVNGIRFRGSAILKTLVEDTYKKEVNVRDQRRR
jgi:hypothetical protein